MMLGIQASSSWVHYTVVLVVALCFQFTAVDTSEIEQLLAAAVRDSLAAAHIELKAAAAIMRIDYPQMLRQLRGEPQQHISLTRLIRLPWGFWFAFLPCLASIVIKKRLAEFTSLPQSEPVRVERVKRSA